MTRLGPTQYKAGDFDVVADWCIMPQIALISLKHHYVKIGIFCVPTVSERNTTVINTNPRFL